MRGVIVVVPAGRCCPHGVTRGAQGRSEVSESLGARRTVGSDLRLRLLAITNEVLAALWISLRALANRQVSTRGVVLSLHSSRSNSGVFSDAPGEQQ